MQTRCSLIVMRFKYVFLGFCIASVECWPWFTWFPACFEMLSVILMPSGRCDQETQLISIINEIMIPLKVRNISDAILVNDTVINTLIKIKH